MNEWQRIAKKSMQEERMERETFSSTERSETATGAVYTALLCKQTCGRAKPTGECRTTRVSEGKWGLDTQWPQCFD